MWTCECVYVVRSSTWLRFACVHCRSQVSQSTAKDTCWSSVFDQEEFSILSSMQSEASAGSTLPEFFHHLQMNTDKQQSSTCWDAREAYCCVAIKPPPDENTTCTQGPGNWASALMLLMWAVITHDLTKPISSQTKAYHHHLVEFINFCSLLSSGLQRLAEISRNLRNLRNDWFHLLQRGHVTLLNVPIHLLTFFSCNTYISLMWNQKTVKCISFCGCLTHVPLPPPSE